MHYAFLIPHLFGGQPAPGLATGFRDLDQLTSGLPPLPARHLRSQALYG